MFPETSTEFHNVTVTRERTFITTVVIILNPMSETRLEVIWALAIGYNLLKDVAESGRSLLTFRYPIKGAEGLTKSELLPDYTTSHLTRQ